jgi:CO/xanthine dehydrogenase Mo-binding subunit
MTGGVRPDLAPKIAGTATFGTDVELPGMLFGALVLASVAHGRIRSVDLSPARSIPGAIAIGAEDLPKLLDGRVGDLERPAFPRETVVYRNQPLAAVAAPSLALAREAARAVRVVVDPLPVVSDVEQVFAEWPGALPTDDPRIAAHVHAARGDVERAMQSSDTVVREVYRTASVHQVALEPHACVADVQGDRWYVRTSTQTPFGVREDVASILGVPEGSIVVDGTWVGGGFGGKGSSVLEPWALLLSRAAGRPVRLVNSYREEFLLGRTTLPAVIRLETGVSAGRIVARRVRLLLDVGTSLPGRDFATGYSIGFLLGPYRTPTFDVEGYAVRTNKPPFGAHRAPFAPQCAFAVESHLDQVAREAGIDPLAFKAEHLWKEGEATPFGQTVHAFGLPAAYAAARELAEGWKRNLPSDHGVGIGAGFWSTNTGAGGEARVVLSPHELKIVQGEREIGSGSVLVGLAAVAERRTGLPRERIRVDYGDTAHAPYDAGVFGSRTVGALGRAVDEALGALFATLKGRTKGSGSVSLRVENGEIVVRVGDVVRKVSELWTADEAASGGIAAEGKHYGRAGTIDESLVKAGAFYPYTDFTGTVHVAEVAMDVATGAVRIVRYAAFQDVGTVMDAPTARAQVEGGIVMGLGTALTEEAIWSEDGRLTNAGLVDYRIPTLTESPPIDVTFVEGFPGAGPFGAKGLGEPPIIPVPATVAAAVREACGAHVTELPLSPERVALALKQRGR